MNFQKILNDFPCNHKFFVPYLALDTIFVYSSIGEELPYDLWINNLNRVQEFGPCPFFEHLRDESALKRF